MMPENMMLPMVVLAALFMIVSHPRTYEMVAGVINTVLPDLELVDEAGHPTMLGQVLHALVFVTLVWVINGNVLQDNQMLVVQ